MKNRFIRKFLVICAAMLFVCAVSVWAAAEETTPATPTDLTPVETADSVPGATEPETTEPDTTVPDTTEPQDPADETIEPEDPAEDEEAADAVELVITKAVRVGDSWSGVMKKTKPAILKLDVAQAQQVNLLVQGRHVWITVEKADRLTENPARTLTENGEAVISWYAEAGTYLITLGPVEPNLMAKANVTILDDAAYSVWLAQQQDEEVTEEEPADETGETEEPDEGSAEETEEPAEDTVEEIPEEETDQAEETTDEPDELTEEQEEIPENPEDALSDPEESGEDLNVVSQNEPEAESVEDENQTNQPASETVSEQEEESEEDIESLLLSQGYYKVQVVMSEGAYLFNSMDENAEPFEHLEAGTELWVKTTEDSVWAEVYNPEDETINCFVKWDSLLIILKPETEQLEEEEEEELPARYIEITSTISNYKSIAFGTNIIMNAELFNFKDEDICEFQWKYYDYASDTYVDIEGANEQTYTYSITMDNYYYKWRVVVTILNEAE